MMASMKSNVPAVVETVRASTAAVEDMVVTAGAVAASGVTTVDTVAVVVVAHEEAAPEAPSLKPRNKPIRVRNLVV
jgi:hypothetical protein